MERNRRIELSSAARQKIMKAFRVTGKTVSNALNFAGDRGQTELAKKIRVMAFQNGGRLMVTWPECETIHDASGVMEQTFGNGCVLKVWKNTGEAKLWYREKLIQHIEKDLTIAGLYVLQEQASGL